MNLSPEWCSWLAGLVDGECCFIIFRVTPIYPTTMIGAGSMGESIGACTFTTSACKHEVG